MAFPTLIEIISTLALLLACGGIASLAASALRMHPVAPALDDKKREALHAMIVVVAVFIITAIMEAFRFLVYRPMFQPDERPPLTVDHYDVVFTGVFYIPWGVFLLLSMKRTRQSHESIGVVKTGWKRALIFGLSMGLAYFVIVGLFASDFSSGYTATASSLVYGLLQNSIIGVSEESVWRGYVQTRIIAHFGTLHGLAGTSTFFALLHFPQRYFLYSGAVLEALSSTLLVIAAGLFFGYIMLKSQNIVAPTVVHIIANWTGLYWGIASF